MQRPVRTRLPTPTRWENDDRGSYAQGVAGLGPAKAIQLASCKRRKVLGEVCGRHRGLHLRAEGVAVLIFFSGRDISSPQLPQQQPLALPLPNWNRSAAGFYRPPLRSRPRLRPGLPLVRDIHLVLCRFGGRTCLCGDLQPAIPSTAHVVRLLQVAMAAGRRNSSGQLPRSSQLERARTEQ